MVPRNFKRIQCLILRYIRFFFEKKRNGEKADKHVFILYESCLLCGNEIFFPLSYFCPYAFLRYYIVFFFPRFSELHNPDFDCLTEKANNVGAGNKQIEPDKLTDCCLSFSIMQFPNYWCMGILIYFPTSIWWMLFMHEGPFFLKIWDTNGLSIS